MGICIELHAFSKKIKDYVFNAIFSDPPMVPENVTLSLKEKIFSVRWNTISYLPNVTDHLLDVKFLQPSQLVNKTSSVTGTQLYEFQLEGTRSCDQYQIGILSRNTAGSSDERLVEGFVPPLPNVSNIAYSYTRSPGTGITRFDVTVSKVSLNTRNT